MAQWLPKSGYLVFNDIDEAEAGRIERKLLEAGPGSALYREHRREFAGTVLELTPHLREFKPLHLYIFLRTGENHPDGLLMCCSNMGLTLWIDGRMMLNYHGRELMIPAFLRTGGGATFGFPFEVERPYLVHIRLLFARRGTRLVLGAGETRGFYLDDYALEV